MLPATDAIVRAGAGLHAAMTEAMRSGAGAIGRTILRARDLPASSFEGDRRERVAGTADMARLYPEPMRHASGGVRKTLRGVVCREVKAALIEAQVPGEQQ